MKKRIADILMDYLESTEVKHVFTLTGGGIMYLVDALGRSGMEYVCCHHEQAAGIAAQACSMYTNSLGVCLVTTGPGATNALTACGASYMDSTPVLFLSGQVKSDDFASKRGVRQFGGQENDIVSMARPVTKYAVLVTETKNALYELQKAVFLATHGRRGPVWVDVPLDMQSEVVDESELRRFDPETDPDVAADQGIAAMRGLDMEKLDAGIQKMLGLLAKARRPLVLIGHGVVAAKAEEAFRAVAGKMGIPVLATWRALDVMDNGSPLFFGSPGLQAARYSNIILQGADFLLVLGSRMDNMITAFSEERFAFTAQKVVVDIDEKEISKLAMSKTHKVVCDAGVYLERLDAVLPGSPARDISPWLAFCADMKKRFPLLEEKQDKPSPLADLYRAAHAIGAAGTPDDALVISSTSRCNTAGHIAMPRKFGQKSVSSMGYGALGFALPSVAGVWFASGKRRVIMLDGDGSLQLNLQELQTIKHHNIHAKLFIFCNSGYAAVATMQDRNFDGFHVGCDEKSGLSMPDMDKIAAAYGFPYVRIASDAEIADGVNKTMSIEGAVLCEVRGDINFDEIPKCISKLNEAGKRVSAALENPYPFLPEEELAAIYTQLDAATNGQTS